jgi:hypothetical protein
MTLIRYTLSSLIQMSPRSRSAFMFRMTMLSFAAALAAFSLWILLPAPLRPDVQRLPTDPEAAAAAATTRVRAIAAARIGGVRGDLWAQSAFTYATSLWADSVQDRDPSATSEQARLVVERTLAYAPHESGVWLLAAGLASGFNWPNATPASLLKMSYYTGPNELHLMPLRLFIATRSNALSDSDIPELVQHDVRMILTRWPELRPALVAAYKGAAPNAKRFLEDVVAAVDPAFLQTMRTSTSPR